MSVEHRKSRAWLLWAGLLLCGLVAVFLLASGLQTSKALAPLEGVTVHKEVNVDSIPPGGLPAPVYTVVFANTNPDDVVLSSITDTLPDGFMFSTMAASSDVITEPLGVPYGPLVWDDLPPVPAGGTLTLKYAIYVPDTVPPDVTPRYNEVIGQAEGGGTVGPASAPLVVGEVELVLDKDASPAQIMHGQAVSYTVTISNDGEVAGTVTSIVDTLDAGLSFDGMVVEGSDITDPPSGPPGGPLVWTGPWEVPARSALVMKYRATTVPGGEERITLCNEVTATSPDGSVTPDEACVQVKPEREYGYLPMLYTNFEYARLAVDKSASPAAFNTSPGHVTDYTVIIVNEGDSTGTLTSVEDVLPLGFGFVKMVVPGSDVTDNPDIVDRTLLWEGSWSLDPGEQLRLIYQASVSTTPGVYANLVTVTAQSANVPAQPAEAIVTVDEAIAGLTASNDGPTPEGQSTILSATVTAGTNISYTWDFGDGESGVGQSVAHIYPAIGTYTATVTAKNGISQATDETTVTIEPAVLLDEDFEDGWDRWTEFLNYKYRLAPGQWYWDSNDGYDGSAAMTQDAHAVEGKEAEDALLMYLQPGAEDWTDYRVTAKMIIRCDDHPHGLWVRGQYKDVGDADPAGWVTGYYIMVGGSPGAATHFVSLKQMQTEDDCWGPACGNPENLYDFNNPHELTITKMSGALARYQWHTIEVEVRGANVKVWLNGDQYIDYTDTKEPFLTGTVGLKTFKANTVSFDDILVEPLD